ncbi:MAG: sensor histidine kinase [Stackebrandtia sp.]
MAIKTRIAASMAVVLSVATVAIGFVAVQAVTAAMTHRIDVQLRGFADHETRGPGPPPPDDPGGGPDTAQYLPMALLRFDAAGDLVESQPAGYRTDPLPLPEVSPAPAVDGKIHTVSAVDGSMSYRVLAVADPDGGTIVVAAATTEVDHMRHLLWLTMGIAIAAVLLVSVLVAWWITSRNLRPVDRMIDDAVAVADGDLRRRITDRGKHTELGKLSAALNRMVSKLVRSIADRDREQARLRRFVANASHELRTPLSVVGGYAQLYRRGLLPPGPNLDRAMERVYSENARLTDLVDDLMLLSRLDSESDIDFDLVDLSTVARDVVSDALALDMTHPIECRADESVVVDGDEARLRQVATNLVTNARVHTPDGTPIVVETRVVEGIARLSVADRGPGIGPDQRDKVFDRFYRADTSRSRDTGGSGLGLAIVASIIELHQGQVTMDSTMGEGTTVSISMPVTETPLRPEVLN